MEWDNRSSLREIRMNYERLMFTADLFGKLFLNSGNGRGKEEGGSWDQSTQSIKSLINN
jgi:hypothetical protein